MTLTLCIHNSLDLYKLLTCPAYSSHPLALSTLLLLRFIPYPNLSISHPLWLLQYLKFIETIQVTLQGGYAK